MKFEESIVINTPIQTVFKYLSNFRSHKKFGALYKETKQLSDGKMKVGTQLFTKEFFLGRKIEQNIEVTEFVPEKMIRFETTKGPIQTEISYVLEEKDSGTLVTLQYDMEPGGFFQLAESFLKPRFGMEITNSMQNLKKILETRKAS